ncbi:hypothetical protein ACFV2N_38530 [Streptomyces sp. NPDC059680]|uniref:hypothetical protein n=1 Tax=Streptomyces sp. NPDC059680 TaxID=3346904 RepID=UPI003679AE05
MALVDLAQVLAKVLIGESLAQGLDEFQAVGDGAGHADDEVRSVLSRRFFRCRLSRR